jgi:S1-C subfamily serine protease
MHTDSLNRFCGSHPPCHPDGVALSLIACHIKLLVRAFALSLLIAQSPQLRAQSQHSLPALIKKIQPAVVTITTSDNSGQPLAQGTGFFVSAEGHLITNYHVMKHAFYAEAKGMLGTYEITGILAAREEVDLILLETQTGRTQSGQRQVEGRPRLARPHKASTAKTGSSKEIAGRDGSRPQPLNRFNTSPEVGEQIVVVGSPEGLEQTVSDGIVSAVRGDLVQTAVRRTRRASVM